MVVAPVPDINVVGPATTRPVPVVDSRAPAAKLAFGAISAKQVRAGAAIPLVTSATEPALGTVSVTAVVKLDKKTTRIVIATGNVGIWTTSRTDQLAQRRGAKAALAKAVKPRGARLTQLTLSGTAVDTATNRSKLAAARILR